MIAGMMQLHCSNMIAKIIGRIHGESIHQLNAHMKSTYSADSADRVQQWSTRSSLLCMIVLTADLPQIACNHC